MKGKIKCYMAMINFFYERVADYACWYNGELCTHEKLKLPQKMYFDIFRNTVEVIPNGRKMVEELEAHADEYLHVEKEEKGLPILNIAIGFDDVEKMCTLGECYCSDLPIGLNVYMITGFLFQNIPEFLLERFQPRELKILYYLIMTDGAKYTDEVRKLYKEKLEVSTGQSNNIRIELEKLIIQYFDYINEVFDKEFDETWENVMSENRDYLVRCVSSKCNYIIEQQGTLKNLAIEMRR